MYVKGLDYDEDIFKPRYEGQGLSYLEAYSRLTTKALLSPSRHLTHEDHQSSVWCEIGEGTEFIGTVDQLSYACKELKLHIEGCEQLQEYMKLSKFWGICSDDGRTINCGYGRIINQEMPEIIELLRERPETRRATIYFDKPVSRINSNSMPCINYLHFYIRSNHLHSVCDMRSNDLRLGFPYDSLLMKFTTSVLGHIIDVPCWGYTHRAMSSHIYNYDVAYMEKKVNTVFDLWEWIKKEVKANKIKIPGWWRM